MMIALGEFRVFGQALDKKINKFHHTLDVGLKNMTSHIDSTKMTSRIQHKTVMQELIVPKKHKTGRGETSRIHPRSICLQGLHTDVGDRANPPSVHDEDTFGDDTAQEDHIVQEDSMTYILGDNGLSIGWLTYKPSFMGTKYEVNVSDLWKSWHQEGVDVITKCGERSKKWRATWTAADVKQYNRICTIPGR
jgi:hypothetical protein